MERRFRRAAGWLAALLLGATAAWADEVEPIAEYRARGEIRDKYDFSPGANDVADGVLSRLRVGLRYTPSEIWQGQFIFQDSHSLSDDLRSRATEQEGQVLELWGRYNGVRNLSLAAGRMPLAYGSERLIGPLEWSNVSRRFDALLAQWDVGEAQVDFFATTIGESPGTRGFDGEFGGAYLNWPWLWNGETEAYVLWKHQYNVPAENVFTLGGRREQVVGSFEYEAEAAFQVGDISAFALSLTAGPNLGPVAIRGGYNVASGDSTPGAGLSTTFDNLFPTNHKYYGIMDLQSWRNMHHLHADVYYTPNPYFGARVGFHNFWLYENSDFWYGASGAPNLNANGVPFRDAAGASGSEVGRELDIVVYAKPAPHFDIEAGWGHFWPAELIENTNRAAGLVTDPADFGYLQLRAYY